MVQTYYLVCTWYVHVMYIPSIWNPDIYRDLILVYLELYSVKLSLTVVIPCYGITQDNYGQKVYTELYQV